MFIPIVSPAYSDEALKKKFDTLKAISESRSRRIKSQKSRMEDLESDLGHVILLVNALAEACVKKGVISREDITQMIHELDLSDGVADGKYTPKKAKKARARKRR